MKSNHINNKIIFGFWLYIMSDCVLFATLFAVYAVLSYHITINHEIISLSLILIETFFLLCSSLTYAMAMLSAKKMHINQTIFWITITFILGLCFICIELYEFYHLIYENFTPCKNAFFSSFFVIVGTHGLHVISGLIWIIVMLINLIRKGLTTINQTRLECLSLFWHFLDIIWICVFTEVYLIKII